MQILLLTGAAKPPTTSYNIFYESYEEQKII
jgi:hypothetical protein